MNKDFKAIYQRAAELKTRFQTAKTEKNTEAMDQVRSEREALGKSIEAKGADFALMYDYYEDARQRGNEHIDISECYEYRDEAALIASFRACGIHSFTFSSGWSSAVEAAWAFIQNGCTLMGMIEINAKTKTWDGDSYEKCPAYLFSI